MNITLFRPLTDGVGLVSQWFGEHALWYAKFGLPGHNGIDYAAEEGMKVLAAHPGLCTVGSDPNGYGLFIKVQHSSEPFYTIYAHLSRVEVSDGQNVWAGNEIGKSGSTGNSTGPHLHFGLRLTGQHMDQSGYRGWINPVPFRTTDSRVVRSVKAG